MAPARARPGVDHRGRSGRVARREPAPGPGARPRCSASATRAPTSGSISSAASGGRRSWSAGSDRGRWRVAFSHVSRRTIEQLMAIADARRDHAAQEHLVRAQAAGAGCSSTRWIARRPHEGADRRQVREGRHRRLQGARLRVVSAARRQGGRPPGAAPRGRPRHPDRAGHQGHRGGAAGGPRADPGDPGRRRHRHDRRAPRPRAAAFSSPTAREEFDRGGRAGDGAAALLRPPDSRPGRRPPGGQVEQGRVLQGPRRLRPDARDRRPGADRAGGGAAGPGVRDAGGGLVPELHPRGRRPARGRATARRRSKSRG